MAASERTLILAEGFSADTHHGKTMRGVLRYRRDDVVAILDSTRAGEDEDGVPVVGDLDEAMTLAPEVALVGVATQGGRFPPAWREILRGCIDRGLSIENGLHEMLADDPELRSVADRVGVELRDLRRPPTGLDCANGANLEVDARLVLTLGSVPHALVLCHRVGSTEIEGFPGHPIPPLEELVALHERVSLPRRRARVVALALHTGGLDDSTAAHAIAEASEATGLPAADPVRHGAEGLLDAVLAGTS